MKQCSVCGKITKDRHPERMGLKFCSLEHYYTHISKNGHPNKGTIFTEERKRNISLALKGKPKSLEHRKKLSEVKKRMFSEGLLTSNSKYLIGKKYTLQERIKHSITCKGINKGKNNGSWAGGHWKERQNLNTQELNQFKRKVLARDEYKCLLCLSKKNLHVHHIIQVATNPSKACDVDNGITLCKPCHQLMHSEKKRKDTKFILIHTLESMLERLDYEASCKV